MQPILIEYVEAFVLLFINVQFRLFYYYLINNFFFLFFHYILDIFVHIKLIVNKVL